MPDNTCFLHSELLASHHIKAIFSLRHHGVSPPPFDSLNLGSGLGDCEENVQQNLAILMRAAHLSDPPHRAVQTHSTDVLTCRGGGCTHQDKADILIGMDNAAVAVRMADCTPILLADKKAGIVTAVHAGWRGTAAQVVTHAAQAMRQHGAKPERILACIGPCIGSCCFEINAPTATALSRHCNDTSRFIHRVEDKMRADLAGINAQQLRHAGIRQAHIEQIKACTCCDAARFYSWRRDGKLAGRHLAVVAFEKNSRLAA